MSRFKKRKSGYFSYERSCRLRAKQTVTEETNFFLSFLSFSRHELFISYSIFFHALSMARHRLSSRIPRPRLSVLNHSVRERGQAMEPIYILPIIPSFIFDRGPRPITKYISASRCLVLLFLPAARGVLSAPASIPDPLKTNYRYEARQTCVLSLPIFEEGIRIK